MTTSQSPRPGGKRAWLTPVLLILVFAGPMLAAWIAVKYEAFRPAGSIVNGNLVDPARPVRAEGLRRLDEIELKPNYLRGHWVLLYIDGSSCDEVCRRSLYHTRQARLAVGEDAHRVRRLMVLTDGNSGEVLRDLLSEHKDLTVATAEPPGMVDFLAQFHVTPGDEPAREQRLYILDPLGNLVIFYGPEADPKGMLEDLERLLKASHIG